MTFLTAAYGVFWAITFALVLSLSGRLLRLERELDNLRAELDRQEPSP
jgi:CcmD family protein